MLTYSKSLANLSEFLGKHYTKQYTFLYHYNQDGPCAMP